MVDELTKRCEALQADLYAALLPLLRQLIGQKIYFLRSWDVREYDDMDSNLVRWLKVAQHSTKPTEVVAFLRTSEGDSLYLHRLNPTNRLKLLKELSEGNYQNTSPDVEYDDEDDDNDDDQDLPYATDEADRDYA